MNKGPFMIRRLGRMLCWPRPWLYRWAGRIRGRGDCFNEDFDLWIDGYPRSANTFCLESFKQANPAARIRTHRHIPPFIIQAVNAGKPGIFLLRNPCDAVVSWSIYWEARLDDCLDYYADFHRVLLPCLPELFIAPFETVTTDMDTVIREFNRRFGLQYASVPHDPKNVETCFQRIEQSQTPSGGVLDERIACRPSGYRSRLKPQVLESLQSSPRLLKKLEAGASLYRRFLAGSAFKS